MPSLDFDGDIPMTIPILVLPVRRQRQVLVTKRQIRRRKRQDYNNLSISRKVQTKRLARQVALLQSAKELAKVRK